METISLPQSIAAMVGIFLPIVIQIFKTKVSSNQLRFLIALGISGVVGTVAAVVGGADLSWTNAIQFATISFAMSQLVYATVKNLFT